MRLAGGAAPVVPATIVALSLASGLRAADAPALPGVKRFTLAASPIGLVGDVRPQQYLGVVGPRSAWLGSETGEAELWVHPLKLASGFRLDFRIPDYAEPVRGRDVARSVEAQSAALEKLRTRVLPLAIAPMSAARCEMDLSPGTVKLPRTKEAGSILISRAGW